MDQLHGRRKIKRGLDAVADGSFRHSSQLAKGKVDSLSSSDDIRIENGSQLQKALSRSRRVGDMLLAREDEELQKIESLAQELIEREQPMASGEAPCQAESEACLKCYLENSDNPTVCSEAVQRYSQCAHRASLEANAGSTT